MHRLAHPEIEARLLIGNTAVSSAKVVSLHHRRNLGGGDKFGEEELSD